MVQTAPLGVGGSLGYPAIHGKAVHAHILILVVVPACTEIGDAEGVGGVVGVHVLRGVQQTRNEIAASAFAVILLSFTHVRSVVTLARHPAKRICLVLLRLSFLTLCFSSILGIC